MIILGLVGIAVAQGLPSSQVIFFNLINSLLVGFEEELMFRDILFQGLLTRFNIWPTQFEHINVYGKYEFNLEAAHQRDGLRELRKPEALNPWRWIFPGFYKNPNEEKLRRITNS